VVNLDGAVAAIKKSVEEAERAAGTAVESVFVGLSGGHIKSFNSRGAVAVLAHSREIGREDIRRVIETAKAVSLPSDREIVHVLPQEFVVDGQDVVDSIEQDDEIETLKIIRQGEAAEAFSGVE